MFFIFEKPYDWCLNGLQFTYIAEIWPAHLRAKGIFAGVAMISLMNIMWLQAAPPTAFETIGWKFYLRLIIPSSIGWFWFPDTRGRPLEEVAAVFGDADEVAVYQKDTDISIDDKTEGIEKSGSTMFVKSASEPQVRTV